MTNEPDRAKRLGELAVEMLPLRSGFIAAGGGRLPPGLPTSPFRSARGFVPAIPGGITTGPSGPSPPNPPSPPATPEDFVGEPLSGGNSFAWSASPGASTYRLERGPDGVTWPTTFGGIAGLSYLDASLAAGEVAYYRLIAVNTGGESAPTLSAILPQVFVQDFMYDADGTEIVDHNPDLAFQCGPWVAPAGTLEINGSRLSVTAGTPGFCQLVPATPDGTFSLRFRAQSLVPNSFLAVVFRYVDATHFLLGAVRPSDGTVALYKNDGGYALVLAGTSYTADTNEHELRVDAAGNSITMLLDGQVSLTTTLALFGGGTGAGIWGFADSPPPLFWDFEVRRTPARLLIVEGDSIARGVSVGVSNLRQAPWADSVRRLLYYPYDTWNFGVDGRTPAQMFAAGNWSTYGPLLTSADAVCCFVGTNGGWNIAGIDAISDWATAVAGFLPAARILIGTGLPDNRTPDADRLTFNTALRALCAADGYTLVDWGSDAVMGQGGQESNPTYYADNLHPTPVGYLRGSSLWWGPAIRALS